MKNRLVTICLISLLALIGCTKSDDSSSNKSAVRFLNFTTDTSARFDVYLDNNFLVGNIKSGGITRYLNVDANTSFTCKLQYSNNPGSFFYNFVLGSGANKKQSIFLGDSGRNIKSFTLEENDDKIVNTDSALIRCVNAVPNTYFTFSIDTNELASNKPFFTLDKNLSDFIAYPAGKQTINVFKTLTGDFISSLPQVQLSANKKYIAAILGYDTIDGDFKPKMVMYEY